ncbi:hypothetical protein [Bartonella choladocola]|uniref:Uncharacterized protein n=1 Tax=Bartonella choladocola TaxID=2750995 RepID=A0A1U9MJB1_9HYPH|nr:hypothetical protein [Bartonella choladocola]AQT48005.1 hypothetical protein BBC0122_019110 [Bartonella choladocola]
MRHLQRNQAEWEIIGNIAAIIDKTNFVILRIASNLKTSRKGIMVDDPHFNTVYIYKEETKNIS